MGIFLQTMAGDAGHLCNCRILRGRHERAKTTLTMDHTLMQHDHDQASDQGQ